MWFIDDGVFKKTDDPERIVIESMFQELQLWLGENPMRSNLGIDYTGVFENRVFLRSSIENIINKYVSSFESIELGELETDSSGEINSITIKIVTKEGSTLLRSFMI